MMKKKRKKKLKSKGFTDLSFCNENIFTCIIYSCLFYTGVSLVKAVPFQYNDPSISGPDIFQRLIPMRAHEASSLYR